MSQLPDFRGYESDRKPALLTLTHSKRIKYQTDDLQIALI